MIRIPVSLAERSYDVIVGENVLDVVPELLPTDVRRVAVITQDAIPVRVDPGVTHEVFTIADGEPAKTLATVERLCRELSRWGLTRGDCIVAVGGGVVTDVGGFVASAYHRGIPVVHVATTLLAQVDAAIGGKCGVNLPEGKNLVGAFWQPHAVLCDVSTLASLPLRERRCGLGEVAKYSFLGAPSLVELPLLDQVAACVRIKADVVSGDERESGRRAILNYGHTLAHALETAGEYDLRHGEAVAIGLVYAAAVAAELGRIDDQRVAEHRRVVGAFDLPTAVPPGLDAAGLIDLFGRDKKAVGALTMVLDGPSGVETVSGLDRAVLVDVLERMCS